MFDRFDFRVVRICLGAALLSCLGFAQAAPTEGSELVGAPLIQRFTAEDYQVAPRHFSVLTDDQGRVFVGTMEGVLIFSHGRFETITLPSDSSARKLLLGDRGRIYVAGYDHFGYLRQDRLGEWSFVDLDERFTESPGPHSLGDVWDVVLLGVDAYFLTAERLYRVGKDHSESWPTPGRSHSMFTFEDELLVRVQGQGLMRFSQGTFTLVPGGEQLASARANAILPSPDGVLIGTRNDGFFRWQQGRVTAMHSELDGWFRQAELYCGLTLTDGTFAVGALNGEVLHLDDRLQLLDRFVASSYPIVSLAADREGGLWAATDGDLVRAAWPSPWTQLTDADGLLGSIEDSAYFGGRRYVATSMGLFASQVDSGQRVTFARIDELGSDEIWDLQVHDGLLFAAHRLGIYQYDGKQFRKISNAAYPFDVVSSSYHGDRLYGLSDAGLVVLAKGTDGYEERAILPIPGVGLYSLAETSADEILVGNFRGFPARLGLDSEGRTLLRNESLDERFGVQVKDGQLASISRLGSDIVLGTTAGISVWRKQRFQPDDLHGLGALIERKDEISIRESGDRRFVFTSRQLFKQDGDSPWERVQISSPLARGVIDVSIEPNGLVSVVTWGALLTQDQSRKTTGVASSPVGMHRLSVLGNQKQVWHLPLEPSTMPTVDPHRLLRFEYGVNSAERGIEYRSWLVGFEPGFSGWSESKLREFSALAPRQYELRIDARSPSGRQIDRLTYAFEVLPRWYQTQWAAWLASGLVLLLAWLLAWSWNRWRSRQLRARNIELERSIEAHTRELEVANQRLAKLAVQDGLTGVTNRRGFEQAYARMWNRLAETRQPMTVLMVDVDFFKQFNDAHGHLAGDEVLRRIARALEAEVHESSEVLARFGGEEFAVLLPSTHFDEAMTRAQLIRERCEEAGREHDITVSIGVSVCVPRGGLKPSQLLDEADAALYRAKKAGRNRIERGRTI